MATTKGERTRAAVIAAAREHFADLGYEGATGSRIASEVGVSEPTIAHHFGSKSGLLVAVIEDYYDELLRRMDEVLGPVHGPEERLRAFARWWLEHNARHVDLLAVFGRQGRGRDADDVVFAFRTANRRVTQAFDRLVEDLRRAGQVREDVSTRLLRDLFFGTSEHVMTGKAIARRTRSTAVGALRAEADDLVEVLLRGAAVTSADDGPTSPTTLARLDAKLDQLLER